MWDEKIRIYDISRFYSNFPYLFEIHLIKETDFKSIKKIKN